MTSNWIAKALGQKILAAGQATPPDKETVILLNGKNPFGDRVYAYILLTFASYEQLLADLKAGKKFVPSEYGEVLAAGKGNPPDDLAAEMATKYDLVAFPAVPPAGSAPPPAASTSFAAPKLWGEED